MKNFPVLQLLQFPSDRGLGFLISTLKEHIAQHHRMISKPHRHDFYFSVLFLKGTGTHQVDFNAYPIKKGSLFILQPGQSHHWEFSDETDGFVLFHSKEFYELAFPNRTLADFPFFNPPQQQPYLQLQPDQLKRFKQLFRAMWGEYQQKMPMQEQKLGSLLDIFYIDLSRNYRLHDQKQGNRTTNLYKGKIRELNELIEQNFRTEKSASSYAAKMNISTKHLNRITQSALGKTTTALIMERVILEAKRMLAHSAVPVSEVAEYLGYTDDSYFSRIFKKESGLSPSQFAKSFEEP